MNGRDVVLSAAVLLGPLSVAAPAGAQAALDPEEVAAAAKLYEAKCGRCHMPYAPSSYAPSEWPGIVRSMRSQAALTREEADRLTRYLVQLASRPRGAEGAAPAPAEAGREAAQPYSPPSPGSDEGPIVGGYLYTEFFQDQQKAKNFDLHYLAVSVSGWAMDHVQYFAEFELEHGGVGGSNTFVEQAYLDYWFTDHLALKVGAILTPFNRFDELHDPISNFTISRPQVSREIGVSAWKDVGVVLHGFRSLSDQATLLVDAYTINGLGSGPNLRGSRQYRDNNEDRALGGRARLVLADRVEIGASGYRGAWDDNGELDLAMRGAFVTVRTPWADFWGEWASADSENPSPAPDGDMSGFFLQASRLFAHGLRPTVRYGRLDYLDTGSAAGRDPAKGNKDLSEWVFSLAYYPTSLIAFKAEYIVFEEGSRLPDVKNNLFGLQAAVKF